MRSCETSQSREAELKELKTRLLERCIGKKRTVHPYAKHLIDLEWAIFGGLSWANEHCRTDSRAAQRHRLEDFRSLYKIAYQHLSIRYSSILFYFRSEPSPAGEWHSHFLIAAKGIQPVSPDVLASTLETLWTEKFNRGAAQIEPFDSQRQLDGICYVCKVCRDESGQEIDTPHVFSKALQNFVKNKPVP